VKHSGQITIDRAVQIPIILLVGMTSSNWTSKQAVKKNVNLRMDAFMIVQKNEWKE
jgi:hypothetical protein